MPPDTLQTFAVEELKLTGRPELAIALSDSGVPIAWEAIALKVMVCGLSTPNDCDTGAAAY